METLTAATVATLAVSKFTEQAAASVVERFFRAREKYEEKPKEPKSSYELKRQVLLKNLTLLQSEVILSQNEDLISNLLPGLLELLIEVYEATTDQDLKLVELSLGHIEGALKLNQKSKHRRSLARSLAIFVSLFALGLLGSLVYWSTFPNGPKEDYVIPIIQVPLPILVWSAIGSFAAILYRFNQSRDAELQDPLRWLFTRPLTGIVMGVAVYFVLKVGLLSFSSEDIDYGTLEILWLVAFIGGFSDRFADTILRVLIGRFGGDADKNILSIEDVTTSGVSSSLQSLVENFKISNRFISDQEDDNKKNSREELQENVNLEQEVNDTEAFHKS